MPKSFPKKDALTNAVKSVLLVYKIFWNISPKLTLTSTISRALIEVLNVVNAFIFARGVDILLKVAQGEFDQTGVYVVVLLFFVNAVINNGLRQLLSFSDRTLREVFYPKYQELIYLKLIKIGIQNLEDPKVNNRIERARRNSNYMDRVFGELTGFIGDAVTVITSGSILIIFAPHLVPIFVIVLIPSVFSDRFFMKKIWQHIRALTEDRRSAGESASYLQESRSLNELIITGSSTKLRKHYEGFTDTFARNITKIRKGWYSSIFGFRVLKNIVEAYADLYVFTQFLASKISIGDVTFYIRQVSSFTNGINSLASTVASLYEASLNITDARELFEMPEIEDGVVKLDRLTEGPEINIFDASFIYPGGKEEVISELNLEIKPGEKVAIVGHNGAGKTTLIKLILRFYRLNKGSVLINGQNVNDLKIDDFYKSVSVLFQDFNAYANLTAAENILIGDLRRKGTKEDVIEAAKMADAHDFITEYENGYDQVLSEKYKGGTRPSTGQWQKIAIARFFYRRASLIIFDEPTAAIDAVSEAKIFNKIYEFFAKKTVIIISHRFSTVRNADRIVVLDKGKIVEDGSHDSLMKKKGVYANAFKVQAKGYK